jgi:hypothetical protein
MIVDKTKHQRIGQPDLREIVELHAQASKKLGLLQEEYQALLDAGEKVSAKAALQRVEKIQTVIRAIEAKVKQSPES